MTHPPSHTPRHFAQGDPVLAARKIVADAPLCAAMPALREVAWEILTGRTTPPDTSPDTLCAVLDRTEPHRLARIDARKAQLGLLTGGAA